MISFRPSVGETFPCTSVQHGATETVSTYLNAFVCSAVVGRVCHCKISAKYGCSVTTALERHLLTLVSWHLAFFLQQMATNHSLSLIHMNLAHNAYITDVLFEEGVWFVVYSALRIRLAWFVVYSAINVAMSSLYHLYKDCVH